MDGRWLRGASDLLLLAAAGCAGARAESVALEVQVHARAKAPGEVLRIAAQSPVPLQSLEGSFLGLPVAMVLTDFGGTAWSGWTVVGLDREPGPATVEVRGTTSDGRPASGSLALEIVPREFPVEELTVEPKYVTPPREVQKRIERERRRVAEVYALRSAMAPPKEPFVRPVPGEPTSAFGTRRLFNGEPRSPHPGIDLRAAAGAPVAAAGGGRVVLADELYYSGNLVILDHGGGLFTLYAHLSRIDVREGQSVRRGERLGLAGATGRVTGPHLHWGAKVGDREFDPFALLDPALF